VNITQDPVRIINPSGAVVCERCIVAATARSRLRGLMLSERLPDGHGLLLAPAAAIHTFFMRFPIQAVFVDARLTVVAVEVLRPWRVAGHRRARAVFEFPVGTAEKHSIEPGMQLAITSAVVC
jgi:uncharacterized membrane protein (UPF0127 family)